MKKKWMYVLIALNVILVCILVFMLLRAQTDQAVRYNAVGASYDDNASETDVEANEGIIPDETPVNALSEPSVEPDIRRNEEGLAGYDYCYVPYMNAEEVPGVSEWFSLDWEPYAAEAFSEHGELIIPQIKTRPLSFQDLTAPYYYDFTPIEGMGQGPDINRMSYSELLEFLRDQNIGFGQLETDNLAFISKVVKMQEENTTRLEENKVYHIDMDLDGTMEEIEFSVTSIAYEKDYITEKLKEYSLYINGILMDTYRNTCLELDLMDLGTCSVLDLHFAGWYEGYTDSDLRLNDRIYGLNNHTPLLLGELNGDISVVLRNGLFITQGDCEKCQGWRQGPIFCYSHIYYVTDGTLYHLSFTPSPSSKGWQQANTLWLLEQDLPFNKGDGSIGTMRKDTKVLICGISEEGDLYLVNEDGQCGYLFTTFDADDIGDALNPVVSVDGLQLTNYLMNYYSFAYAE